MREDADGSDDRHQVYDREFVLFGPYRDKVLELWQVQRYGTEMFGHPDAISLYGMHPADWHARGIRVMGRTAVECTRDDLAKVIAADVAALVAEADTGPASFFFNDTAITEIYTLSLHDALPISAALRSRLAALWARPP